MQQPRRRYPIGTQTFSILREGGYVYVDKTELMYQLVHDDARYVFLSRPRRFGKSLLLSTMSSYFEGKRELFKGLAIDRLETQWEEHPVLWFDMSTAKHVEAVGLIQEIEGKLCEYEKLYGREASHININQRLEGLIKHAYQLTGKQVVVLVDEYDSPLLDVVHDEDRMLQLRQVMRCFYSPLKSCDPYLRFVFLTGITKFSQLSIFSELNNIRNISMLPEYAAICGISKEELLTQLSEDIKLLAGKLRLTREEALLKLVEYYDGYHFTWPSPDMFNPYSLMSAFADGSIKSYWFGSGTPTSLVEMLRKYDVLPSEIGEREARSSNFDSPTERMTNITPLLYQSGYLTIKDYDAANELYRLEIPNREIRNGLMGSLLPKYVELPPRLGNLTLANMHRALQNRDMDQALRVMQTYLSSIPYTDNTAYEGHYQQVLYILFSLLNYYVDVEVHTATGRVDLVMRTKTDLYIIEVKLNGSAEAAMSQINLKDYAARFSTCGLPLTKVGVSFDQRTRTLSGWVIRKA